MTYRAPTPPAPEREKKRGTVVRMPESPEDEALRLARERREALQRERSELASALRAEAAVFDRRIRIAGAILTALAAAALVWPPHTTRGAVLQGVALVCGPLALLLGSQGARDAHAMPLRLRALYIGGFLLGAAIGSTWLR
jgi:hypothetical protein